MSKLKSLLLGVSSLFLSTQMNAQYFNSFQGNNRAGIYGLYTNPSSISGSRVGVEVNLLSMNSSLIALPFENEDTKKYQINGFSPNYVELLLPSVIVQNKQGIAFGLSSRSRIAYEFEGNKGLYETFLTSIPGYSSSRISNAVQGFKAQGLAVSDVGFSLAAPVVSLVKHNVTLGATYRLMSVSAMENYDISASNNSFLLTGNSLFGGSNAGDKINFDFKAGSGLDLGFTYEYRNHGEDYLNRMDGKDRADILVNKYLVKVGFAVNDIGELQYDTYEANPVRYGLANYTDTPLDLEKTLTYASVKTSKKMKLPTRTALNVDVRMGKKGWYLGTLWVNNLTKDFSALRQASLVSVAPRFERKGFQFSVPLTYYTDYQQTAVGVVLKLGPIMIGSDNLSFLWNKNAAMGNIHAGIVFQFGRKQYRDDDQDGVSNRKDKCPTQKGVWIFRGCPDDDNDGVMDQFDDCPDMAGPASSKGCPDKDGDGIYDKNDSCPTEPGLAKFNGCPDTDGDGIKDSEDDCPTEKGLPELGGCPDQDGDGVKDSEDNCPTVKGSRANRGCPDKN
ncbi:MAG: thrombospondin type 3 repeat-containing protein [Spirosomataceae bacterium]